MALSFTTQSIVIDESFDLTDNDISLAQFATDEPALYAHLITSNDFPKSNAGDLSDPEIAWQSDFLNVTVPVGTTLNDITFAQNSAGLAFSTTLGVASGIKTVDGSDIWLFADPSNENILLGRIGADGTLAASGDVAFAIVLDEAADHSSAGLYIVQYAALYNPDGTNPDDRLSTLTDKIFISADSTAPILFSDFADVPSGNTDFAIIAPDSAGLGQSGNVQLLVTGFDGDGNATVNVSTSGLGAASQSIGVDAMLQIDFVTGATQGTGTANQIAYGTHYETQEAGFKVTQINPTNSGPNPNRVDVQISALNVTGDEQGLNFYDGSATSAVTITRVQVLAADGVTIIEDTQAGGADDATITITINGATADIKNLLLNQSVRFYTSGPMDRFTAKNIDTSSNTSFDLGGFYFTGTQENSDYKEVGSLLSFDDDGPSIAPAGVLPLLSVDESALPTGNTEAGASTTASADFSTLFAASGGADGSAGLVYTLDTLGGDSGLVDSLTGNSVTLAKIGSDIVGQVDDGGTMKTVFTITLDASGTVTFTQERAIRHADATNPDDSTGLAVIENLITLKAAIADGDTDGLTETRDITSAFAIEDDGPTLSISQDMFALIVDESSLASGSDAASTEESATFDISSMITSAFGADGAGTRTLDLALHGGATELDSGLVDMLTGHTVWLFKEGDDIVGREGATAATATEEVIRVSLNAGTVGFSLSRAIVHPDGSNPDDRLTLGENLIDLVATIMDSDKDPLSGIIDLGPHLAIDDDGPSVTGGSVAAGALTVDETHLTAATNGIDGSDPNAAATSATLMGAALFSKVFGADGPYGGEDKIGYVLAIAADDAPTGLYDTASKAEILLKVNAEGTLVTGYVAAGDAFTLALAADGTVTLTQLRAVMHGSADAPSDSSEAATLMGSGLISLLAGAQDGDTDKATTASVDLTGAIAFLDDGPTIGPVTPTDNNGTFNVRFMAGEDNVGTIGGVDGADAAVTSLVSVVDVSHESVKDSFDIVQNGNHVDFYLKGTMEKWFTFDLTDNAANPDSYNFTVLKDGVTQNEDLNFKIKAGPPVETLSVDSVFDNANIVFDGLIFGSVTEYRKPIADPTLASYNKGTGSAADDINPNNLGFGIKGVTPSQASQINNNEGFSAYLGEGVDNLTFGIQGIGNNAVGVQVEYWLYDDADNDPTNNGTPGNLGAALVHKTVDIDGLDAGNHLEYVTIDDQVTFDTVYVHFYYDADKGDLANSNKNILSNAGVRVQDFSIKNETTVPEYDFQFNVARTDRDEAPIGTPTGDTVTTALTIHVDPDWMFS